MMGDVLNAIIPSRIENFVVKALKGFQLRVKLSADETYSLLKTNFEGVELPDAVDLVDELGLMANELDWFKMYDEMPFVKDFVDALHDFAHCDIEMGYTSEQRTFSFSFHTKGIKEIFDLIMQGCVFQSEY